jgi:hypothetical protein
MGYDNPISPNEVDETGLVANEMGDCLVKTRKDFLLLYRLYHNRRSCGRWRRGRSIVACASYGLNRDTQ